ncbi:MAG: ABC transporter C-terminal domain-containing protein, partial [Actinomycetota bacterium]|nr:ABC transporter C-terminal domain-containing protein [Actinomycetota bacterium]
LTAWLAETEAAAKARSVPATGARRAEPGSSPRSAPARRTGQAMGASRGRSATTIGSYLRETERTMARLGREQARLATELASACDHEEMARVGSALADVGTELAETEERWLSLAEEAEGDR